MRILKIIRRKVKKSKKNYWKFFENTGKKLIKLFTKIIKTVVQSFWKIL